MANKTPDSTDPGTVGGVAALASGAKHLRLPFITENVDNLDIWQPGAGVRDAGVGILMAAWEPNASTDDVAVTIASNAAGPLVLFSSAADNNNGYLHVWVTE